MSYLHPEYRYKLLQERERTALEGESLIALVHAALKESGLPALEAWLRARRVASRPWTLSVRTLLTAGSAAETEVLLHRWELDNGEWLYTVKLMRAFDRRRMQRQSDREAARAIADLLLDDRGGFNLPLTALCSDKTLAPLLRYSTEPPSGFDMQPPISRWISETDMRAWQAMTQDERDAREADKRAALQQYMDAVTAIAERDLRGCELVRRARLDLAV